MDRRRSRLHENPYDGHTLSKAIQQSERLTGVAAKQIVCGQGYRGHDYVGSATVHVVRSISRRTKTSLRKLLRRRSAIEPIIGHMKQDNRLQRNHLTGKEGDRINVILAAAGYNLRKLLAALFFALVSGFWYSRSTQKPSPRRCLT